MRFVSVEVGRKQFTIPPFEDKILKAIKFDCNPNSRKKKRFSLAVTDNRKTLILELKKKNVNNNKEITDEKIFLVHYLTLDAMWDFLNVQRIQKI